MSICIYARKSVYSDRSDSVSNQIRMCREYCALHLQGDVEEYSDEDYSGKDTDRPGLAAMMERISSGECSALVVYQLDRLTRSVRDFALLYQQLSDCGVDFVSVRENIDTSTPIGRAMMYIIVIFAQMERETIAARTSDNLLSLARQGWWTAGAAPVGYQRQRVREGGREHVTLVVDEEKAGYVRGLFGFFLQGGYSLQGCETALKHKGVKAPGGGFLSTTQIHQILTSPFSAPATPEVYDYFAGLRCIMDAGSPREKWNGSVGVMVYGRTSEASGKHQKMPPSKWTVCLGRHEPLVSAEAWLAAQAQFRRNKFEHKKKHPIRLLKGTLRCGCCGNLMQVSYKKKADGYSAWYYCLKRMRQGPDACPMGYIKCDALDDKVLEIFRRFEGDPETIREAVLRENAEAPAPDPEPIRARLRGAEARLERLTGMLGECASEAQERAVFAEVGRQAEKVERLEAELREAVRAGQRHAGTERDVDRRVAEVQKMIKGLDGFDADERNEIVRKVFRVCSWDGETLRLQI